MRCLNGTCDLDPDEQTENYFLSVGDWDEKIPRKWKSFILKLSKGSLGSDLEVDFNKVNHECVIEAIQQLIDVMEAEGWTIEVKY